MIVDWDPAKNRANRRKHGICFNEAAAVFQDPNRIEDYDDRDYGAERWGVIGRVGTQIVHVAYTERHGGLRLISARKTAQHEEARYFGRGVH